MTIKKNHSISTADNYSIENLIVGANSSWLRNISYGNLKKNVFSKMTDSDFAIVMNRYLKLFARLIQPTV